MLWRQRFKNLRVGLKKLKLSEQIKHTCCGVLANRENMIKQAQALEEAIEQHKQKIEELEQQLMEIDGG